MSIQAILDKIRDKSQKEADKILENGKVKAQKEKELILEKGEKACLKEAEKAKKRVRKLKEKAKYLAKTVGKKELLKAKRRLIEEVIAGIEAKLNQMSDEDYKHLIKKLLSQISLEEGVYYPCPEKADLIREVIEEMNLNLKPAPQGELSSRNDLKGGLIIESQLADFDFSFKSLVSKTFKRDLEKIIAQKLF
jgi:vacuolar-type H+-ATPase subunit E/Vma4